jgi:hypothetical protein
LPLSQAPAATQSFFWGTIDVSAPGFVGPPADTLTVSLDESGGLRFLSFKTLPMFTKTFGDGPDQYPLAGTKHVTAGDGSGTGYDVDVTVLENPPPTGEHFLLSYHVVSSEDDDFVESTEGTLSAGGWVIKYSLVGSNEGAPMNAQANGTIYAGDPSASMPAPGQPATWSAPVELTAPGFYGPPVDHLTVATDPQGQIQSFSYQRFHMTHTFGGGPEDFPLSGTASVGTRTVAVDMNSAPSPDHFVLRYHVQGPYDDYEEGLDGTRTGTGLAVRYFIQGSFDGAAIDAHAAGMLVPASP